MKFGLCAQFWEKDLFTFWYFGSSCFIWCAYYFRKTNPEFIKLNYLYLFFCLQRVNKYIKEGKNTENFCMFILVIFQVWWRDSEIIGASDQWRNYLGAVGPLLASPTAPPVTTICYTYARACDKIIINQHLYRAFERHPGEWDLGSSSWMRTISLLLTF